MPRLRVPRLRERKWAKLKVKNGNNGTGEMFNAKGAEVAKGKHGKGCPLITRMNTNEYFAVNLILHHKIKLTASVSILLVLPPCGMPFVVKLVTGDC